MESFLVGNKMGVKNGGVDGMGESGVFKDVGKEDSCINQTVSCSEESSSSIGRDSDASMEKSCGGEEVQSSFKGTFDAAMEALEEVLPIRRGISRFYNGKSNSFACLADASKGLVKPDNAYKRRRRNLLACSLTRDKNRGSSLSRNGGGISKRLTASSRRAMALNKMTNVVVMDQC
ncbi:protein OXIDATIVE STRESS 3 LIKE 1-like [Salvia miltiorrhiza]|uniref:protein OXIDATIVE STRESS 3 LIKE 1-like n=1 Tax=Salvia miltiorrhiza TaxID=226208 RepID=UPI0025AC49A1|nr:protein OXIDATIVE STRESS 3 LIKE 1-like [Salvia miltiorrhiza]